MKRSEMEQVIAAGGSVLHEGRLHTSVATLPSKAQMAKSDEDKAAAAGDLDAQIAALQAQRAALKTSVKAETTGGDEGGGKDDTLEELMKHTREQLIEKARELGVEIGEQDTKAQISKAILAKGKK